MLYTSIHSDEITVWWEKQWELASRARYRVTLNGNAIETDYTHASFKELTPETAYRLRVDRIEGDTALECLGELHLATTAAKRRIDVTAAPYFAVGDGKTMNTKALQRAINDCGALDCVYFPAGTYLSGALDLHSDMELYLDEGALLQGSAALEDYLPKRESRFEGISMMCYSSLINAGVLDSAGGPNCRNIVIRGKGSILGGGLALADAIMESERTRLADYLAANQDFVKTCENENTIPARARNRLINLSNCENVTIAGLTLGYAASWNVHFIYCRNVLTYGCHICSQGVWNGDGWDPDSAENSVLFDTTFDTHDNSIAIKSGKNPDGNIINRPCVGVWIFHCGGRQCMAVGSEMSGGVSDVKIWDCDFTAGGAGIGLKVTDKRGGYIRNVRVRDCRFVNLRARRVTFNDDGEPAPTLPFMEDILFENVEFTGVSKPVTGEPRQTEVMLIEGPNDPAHYFRRMTFDGIRIPCTALAKPHVFHIKNVAELTIKNIECVPED